MEDCKYGKLVDFVHFLITASYGKSENLNFIDATCGNGFDTLFLCELAGENGHVIGFDIQEQAIERTKLLLKDKLDFINYDIILDSHEHVDKYLTNNIHGAVFNLGYLPNSNKSITTNGNTTIKAIENLLPHLNLNGRIFITTYITHDTGDEIKDVISYLKSLNKQKYNVININIINKSNTPPELFIIERNA